MSVVLAAAMIASTAHAGAFLDDFEGDPLGATPVADTGSYTFGPLALAGGAAVSSAQAHGGTQSLYISGGGAVNAVLDVSALENSTVHAEFWVYVPSGGTYNYFLGSLNGTGALAAEAGGPGPLDPQNLTSFFEVDSKNDPVLVYHKPEGSVATLVATPDTWEKYELDYVVGATTIDMTVAGVQVTGLSASEPYEGGYQTMIDGLWLWPHTAGRSMVYIDDVSITVTGEVLNGDLWPDGYVDALDEQVLRDNWGTSWDTDPNGTWTPGDKTQGDPSGDGFVGAADVAIVRLEWHRGTPPVVSASVPEPGSLALLALGGLVLLVLRRRCRV